MRATTIPEAECDLGWALGFLGARAVASVERIEDNRYTRIVATTAGPLAWTVSLTPVAGGSRATVRTERLGGDGAPPAAFGRASFRHQFDLDRDLGPFRAMAARDRVLRRLVGARPGLRLPRLADPFEALVRAIVGQLISVAAARTILGRLASGFGDPVGTAGRTFPSAASLASTRPERLRSIGLPTTKAAAILAAARAVRDGDLPWTTLAQEPERADRVLRSLPGVGPWTSGYVRLRALGDGDAFLPTDLGVRSALTRLGIDSPSLARRTDAWRPWRGLAVGHLWASLAH